MRLLSPCDLWVIPFRRARLAVPDVGLLLGSVIAFDYDCKSSHKLD